MLAARRTYGVGRSTLGSSAVAVSRCSRLGALAHATTTRCRSSRIGSIPQVPAARQQHFRGGSAPGANSLPSSPDVGFGRPARGGRRPAQLPRTEGKTEWVRYQDMMHQRTGLARRDQLSSLRGGVVGPSVNNDASSGGVATSADSGAAAAAAGVAEASEPDMATPTAAGSSVMLSPSATMATTSSESTAVIDEWLTFNSSDSRPSSDELHATTNTTARGGPGPDDGDSAASDTVPPIAATRQETSSRISSEDAVITDLDRRREAALNAELKRKFGTEPPQREEISGKPRRRRSRGCGRRGAAHVEGTANDLQHEPLAAASGGGGIAPAAESETEELNEVPVAEAVGPITGVSGDGAKPASGEGTPRSRSADESRRGRINLRGGYATGDGKGGGSLGRGGRGKQAAAASEEEGGEEDSGDSYSQQRGSAWKNIHAKKKLRWLLKGLASDYGVQEMLALHHISKHTMSKLLRVFEDLVLDHPDTAFPGEEGQKLQEEVSSLCYHPKFQADAVLKKRPIRTRTTSGRSFTFSSKQPKRGREGPFVKERNDVVEKGLIPRLVELAQESYADEIEATKRMDSIVDLRNPQQGFPLARLRKRRIIYHGGPTNSGKTYQAIERLKKAGANRQPGDRPAGLFCGPLRLLALEVYEQLNSQGIYCSLMTGQEKREVPFATHVSCTIEMASTVNEYEVAVIDEIQMLADEQRGPSWTSAVLGLNCPEIHVCGGMEGAVLVEAMAKETGDDFELREYQRKTELVCAEESLGNNYKNIQPGDAVVAFSRRDIFSIKREIESKTPHKCCVIYGSLPQETRAHQARLFNSEDTGYDVLVASDAIGMGLNLNIRRVVFHAVSKRTGGGRPAVKLPPTMLKQIGGRAGRHGKQWEYGEVTCLKSTDMAYMNKTMNTPLEPIPKAAIFPSVQHMQEFSNCLDETEAAKPEGQERRRLAETFAAFADEAKVGDRYFLGTHDQHQALANALHPVENLTLKERYAISMAPINGRNALLVRALFLFATAHAAGLPVFINMQLPPKGTLPKSMTEFQTLCSKHNVLDLYRWMGVRFPSIECFTEKSVAEIQRVELESMINEALKRRIAVTGPDSISAPEHDTYSRKLLRALNSPNGGDILNAIGQSGAAEEEEEGEGEGVEYML